MAHSSGSCTYVPLTSVRVYFTDAWLRAFHRILEPAGFLVYAEPAHLDSGVAQVPQGSQSEYVPEQHLHALLDLATTLSFIPVTTLLMPYCLRHRKNQVWPALPVSFGKLRAAQPASINSRLKLRACSMSISESALHINFWMWSTKYCSRLNPRPGAFVGFRAPLLDRKDLRLRMPRKASRVSAPATFRPA